jgi:hypothetical protein
MGSGPLGGLGLSLMLNLQPTEMSTNQDFNAAAAAAAAARGSSSRGIGFDHDEPLQYRNDASTAHCHIDAINDNDDSGSDCEGQFSWRQQLLRSP